MLLLQGLKTLFRGEPKKITKINLCCILKKFLKKNPRKSIVLPFFCGFPHNKEKCNNEIVSLLPTHKKTTIFRQYRQEIDPKILFDKGEKQFVKSLFLFYRQIIKHIYQQHRSMQNMYSLAQL